MNLPGKNSNFSIKKLATYFSFLILTYVTYFLFFKKFGLYEDDIAFVAVPINSNFGELIDHILKQIIDGLGARPFAKTVSFVVSYISFNVGGLNGLYIAGMLIVTLNEILVFTLIKKKFNETIALIGTLVFLFFPADTTKGLLVHIYQLQVSLTYSLIACHLYLNNRKLFAYLMATLSLFTYESPYLIFLFAPFLVSLSFSKKKLINFAKHIGYSISIFTILFIIRKLNGEPRVNDIEAIETLRRLIISIIEGPLITIYSFLLVPLKSLIHIQNSIIIVLPVFLILAAVFILNKQYFYFTFQKPKDTAKKENKKHLLNLEIPEEFINPLMAIAIGALMLIGSYLFAFTHYPPRTLVGRGTSVHLASSVASAFLFGGLGYLIIYFLRVLSNWLPIAFFVFYFSLLAGNGIFIQKDFITSWKNQKLFWSQIIEKCSDLDEETYIVVEREQLPATEYIFTHAWPVPIILENLYRFPEDWVYNPKVVILEKPLNKEIYKVNNKLYFKPVDPFLFDGRENVELQQGNVIYVTIEDDKVIRHYSDIKIDDNKVLKLKEKTAPKQFKKKNLYPYLVHNYND